jgi:hypothetical protein
VEDGRRLDVVAGLELGRLLGVKSGSELARRVDVDVIAKYDDVDVEDIEASKVEDDDASIGTIVRSSP